MLSRQGMSTSYQTWEEYFLTKAIVTLIMNNGNMFFMLSDVFANIIKWRHFSKSKNMLLLFSCQNKYLSFNEKILEITLLTWRDKNGEQSFETMVIATLSAPLVHTCSKWEQKSLFHISGFDLLSPYCQLCCDACSTNNNNFFNRAAFAF